MMIMDLYIKGVASIESYESSTPLGKWIINMLSEILDYLIGILTLGIRVVIVGWTAIIEKILYRWNSKFNYRCNK